jgi:hypothetical protein
MASFAKLDTDNRVLTVVVVNNSDILDENGIESETIGVQFLLKNSGWPLWKKTSFNTVLGKYYITDPVTGIRTLAEDQSKAFRKNCAGIGFSYSEEIDGFVPPKLFTSWLLDSTTGGWYPPVPRPEVQFQDEKNEKYVWNEENTTWDKYINTNLDKNLAPVWEKV